MPCVALGIALAIAAAAPSFASSSLRILSPLSGTTVSGDVVVDGTITTNTSTDLTVGLAEQNLGECGALVAERSTQIDASTTFSFTVSTALLSDGVYCVVAISDGGARSHVVGDVTLDNEVDSVDDLQLPTLAEGDSADDSTVAADTSPFAGISALAPVVFAAAAVLGMLVLVFAHVARRRLTD